MKFLRVAAAIAALFTAFPAWAQPVKPTIVLVHGAFADSSSWSGVIHILEKDGYPVVAVANPLRSVQGDARYVDSLLATIPSPVVLVGHSYGGTVITEAAAGAKNVKALVYVSALAPTSGETTAELAGKFPGSTLGAALAPPVPLPGGEKDLYVQQDKFPAQFAADIPLSQAKLMAAEQRPITAAALNEPVAHAAWQSLPSWFIYGNADKNIPPQASAFMAARAHARQTIVIKGGSHVIMLSHPAQVAAIIETAATN